MTELTPGDLEKVVEKAGEVEVVLDSGEVYELHNNGLEGDNNFGVFNFSVIGMHDGELKELYFNAEDVEHVRTHKKL